MKIIPKYRKSHVSFLVIFRVFVRTIGYMTVTTSGQLGPRGQIRFM